MRLSLGKATKVIAFIGFVLLTCQLLINNENSFVLESFVKKFSQHGGRENKEPVVLENGPDVSDVIFRQQRSAKSVSDSGQFLPRQTLMKVEEALKEEQRQTQKEDLFISVKTTKENHDTRMKLLMETWIPLFKEQTYIFTDEDDKTLSDNMPDGHVINTNCTKSHYRTALCCKMAKEFDNYMMSKKRWFCHVDDDTYLNVDLLVKFLQKYNHLGLYYLGKPSLKHPIETYERSSYQKIVFWFATGGAGFCVSRGLALKMVPYAGGGRFITSGDAIRLPDDCTMGYIINYLLKIELTKVSNFHSHLEALWRIKDPEHQLTFSYNGDNVIDVKGLSLHADPTRFRSAHCRLYPNAKRC